MSTPRFLRSDTPSAQYALDIPTRTQMHRHPLATEKSILLPVELTDGPEIWDSVERSRAHLSRWLPWVPYANTLDASQRYADACVADWDAGRAVRFVLRDRSTRVLQGVVGLDNCIHLHRSCELGYWLDQRAEGRGLMTDSARVLLHFGFRRMGVHRVRCAAATDNHRSLAVIARLGFRMEGVSRQAELVGGRWLDHAVFSLLSTDR